MCKGVTILIAIFAVFYASGYTTPNVAHASNLNAMCAVVDPVNNDARWVTFATGRVFVAHYVDNGDNIVWDRRVPRFVHRLVVSRRGTSLRFDCVIG